MSALDSAALDLIRFAVELAFVGVFTWAGLLALLDGQNQTSPGATMPGSEGE